jgi:hypothetical protein
LRVADGAADGARLDAGINSGVSSGIGKRKLRAARLGKPAGTGPTSVAGKARSSQNARKHGLNVPVMNDPTACAEIEAIAAEIVPGCQDAELLGRARRIAEAQIDLIRVARARRDVLSWAMASPDRRPADEGAEGTRGARKLVYLLTDLNARLIRLDRYERVALSRRKHAIQSFEPAWRKALRRLGRSTRKA